MSRAAVTATFNKKLTTHVVRHTFATTITLANEVSIENVSKMLGHTKLTMTQEYVQVLDQSIKSEMENVKELINKARSENAEENAKLNKEEK